MTGASASGGAGALPYKWTFTAGAGVDAGAACSFSPSDAVLNPSVSCTDDGPFTLTLTVTGSNGQSASDNASLTLSNAPPVAEAGGPYSGNEGTAITLGGSGDDPGDNDDPALTYAWTVDVDGLGGGTCAFDDASSKDAKVTCTDNGTATLTLTVSDGDGGSDTDTATLTIGNAAPVADAGGPYSGNEGSAIPLNGSATDAGSGDTHTWLWAYVSGPGFDAGATCAFSNATLEDPTITCTDDGVVQLTLTVQDDDDASDSDEATLTIANVAPVANAGGSYSGDEGGAITLNGSATDAGTNDVLSYLWSFDATGLGSGTCQFDDASKKDAKITCNDNGTVTLTLTVTDDDGDADTDTATLTLANVGPVANAGLDYSGDEGSAVQLNGSVTDAGTNDTHTWSWAYVAGAGLDAGGSCSFSDATAEDPTVTCTDDGTVELTLTVTDDDGESGTDTAILTLANVDPVADAGTSYNGVEGSAVALNGSVSDAGSNDTHTWSWQYVGGAGVDAGATCQFSNAAAEDPTITCTDDGIVQLTLTVTDDDGGSDSDQATLTLTNAPPVAEAGGAYTGSEGSAIQLAGSATDPGTNDALTYAWTVDASGIDGGGTCTFDNAASKDAKVTCTDNGSATLTLTVKDDDGGEDTDTATLTVGNVDPVADAGGPYAGAEGGAIAISGSESDAGSNDVLSRAWTYTPGAGVDAGATCAITSATALAASITCTDDGTYQVTLTVQDDDGGSHASNAVLTVSNAAPVLSAITAPLAPVNITTPVVVSATFTDAGTNDTHTGIIDWGDGTSAASITETNGSGTASGSHTYGSPGVYTVRMTVTDDDGSASNESVYQYVVVFDPSAGFVTGGGWLNSTPGMYRVDAAAQGKANFGFVSKYQKGAAVPTGNTEFQFHAGDLNFKSSVYQWLVVQGQTKASYKGSGTINGAGNFGFLLSVIDGGNTGDKFRIKIWDRDAADAVVYDNLLASAGDDALPTTSVLGGNIVVHAK